MVTAPPPSAIGWPRGLPFVHAYPSLPISGEGQGCMKGSSLHQSSVKGCGHMKGSLQPISSEGQGRWGPLANQQWGGGVGLAGKKRQ